ncbi:hypothetical protein [Aliidiomarina celeris]|uniref:hypothetical protein n=1 Tax=Aliidiomarina celeris TaxID=2249428 RepID=UPI000DE87CD9|nr:hypothetical protein [Aliidiomarina celeris]
MAKPSKHKQLPQKKQKAQEKRLPRSIKLFGWSVIAAALFIWGIPLAYDIYLAFTPALPEHIERQTRTIAEHTAVIFGIAVFVLGCLLALRRWQWERKRARLQQLIRDYKIRKAMKARESESNTNQ